jgi:hypothetical protein
LPTFLDTTRTALKRTCPAILLLLCVFVIAVTFLSSILPSNDKGIFNEPSRYLATMGDTHTDNKTGRRDFLIRPLGSGAVIYVPSFIQIGSSIQKLIEGEYTHIHTHGQQRDLISLCYFFKMRKVG